VTPTTASRTRRVAQDETVRLARQVAAATGPTEALRTTALLRRHLDAVEAAQVDAALKTGYSWRLIAEALGISRQAAHRRHAARVAAAAKLAEEQSVAGSRLVIVGPVRAAVVMAREEAAAVESRLVGTEHLLVGLMRERKGDAAVALTALGVTLEKVRHCAQATADRAHGDPETEDHSPPAWATPSRLPFSRRGRQALEQALREAVRLGDDHLGVEHLLLALVRDPDSRAVRCLERLTVATANVEDELQRLRGERSG
jgi:hypothetical protein